MSLACYQVDSFTRKPYTGNPAAVVLLDQEKSGEWMQKVAAEMNLSETGFVLPSKGSFGLRWFTPTTEVDLCGHCTLASAHTLWDTGVLGEDEPAVFQTRSGKLQVRKLGDWMEMDFPAWVSKTVDSKPSYLSAVTDAEILSLAMHPLGHNLIVEVPTEDDVRRATPNFSRLRTEADLVVILTARSEKYDFVSRCFPTCFGIDEDPVTGAAHCVLGPYWRVRLGKDTLSAFQVSSRGGEVRVHYDGGDRIRLQGQAVTVWRGTLSEQAL
ncbi:MAG: PhzF family phenazine biosynthesis protein [Bdellovibrionaceae bacterium]|nr:PhzF family phenazine biosynthesis protein [Bdellovibrionales bacterium]MCB9254840.1 PhzF family phenazine biosynthesis protein [Pseudobdellovibrionaceae bacterium]